MEIFNNQKEFSLYKIMMNSFKGNPKTFLKALIFIFFNKICLTLTILLLGYSIDSISLWKTDQRYLFLYYVGGFILSWFFVVLIRPAQVTLLSVFIRKAVLEKTMIWFSSILNKDLSFYFQHNTSRVVNIIGRGIFAYEKLFYHFCANLLPILIEVLILSVFLFYYTNWYLYLLAFILNFLQVKES